MPVDFPDPQRDVHNRGLKIIRRMNSTDPQELSEREQAAQRYALENEAPLVDFAHDFVKTSIDSTQEIRQTWADCWRMYKEREPASYANKESWMARTVLPKPYQTVQYGVATVKKAFSPDFLTIKDESNRAAAKFWQRVLEIQLGATRAKFVRRFMDALTMALAVGQSMELIPIFRNGRLQFVMAEPWKIHRDPDAPPRDPQGGLAWAHTEWLGLHVLKAGEKAGRYINLQNAMNIDGEPDPHDPFMTKEAINERKKQIYQVSGFRKLVFVTEMWGQALSPNGEVVLENATYTIAGGRLITKPRANRYRHMRWPGNSFSALPDILGFGGRGLLEGVRSVWESMCNIMCLHEDAMKWIVNPSKEINLDGMEDPTDVEDWPGKSYLTRDTPNGQQVIREVRRRDTTNSALANLQYYDQNYQRGSYVTDSVQGLPGYRKDMTFRESAQNLGQALGVFGLMGENTEEGAVNCILAAQDAIATYATYEDYVAMVGPDVVEALGIRADPERGVTGLPALSGSFHISGLQALMKDAETLQSLVQYIIPLSQQPRYGGYVIGSGVIRALERLTNLEDRGLFVDDETAKSLDKLQMNTILAGPRPEPEGDGAGAEPTQGVEHESVA